MSWPLVKIKDVFDVARGGSPRPIQDYLTDDLDGYNWVMIGDTKKGSKYIESTAKKIRKEGLKKTRQVKPGDFLLTNSMSFGRPYIMKTSGCVHDGWLILSPKSDQIFTDYFYHYLGSEIVYNRLAGKAAGAVVKNLNKDVVKELEIPLPPLAEQKRIAAILDKADQLRQKRQQAIALADDFLRSVFLDMFGDPVTNPKRWEVKDISDVCTDIVDCVNRTAPTVDYETPYKMIRTTNVRGYKLHLFDLKCVDKDIYEKWIRRLRPQKGDIIFTREAPAGEAGIIETNDLVFLGQRTMHFRPDKHLVKPAYLLYELMGGGIKQQIRKLSSGSTVTHLSVPECKKFKVRVPPIELQEAFETIKLKLESIKDVKRTANELPLFNSLCQKVFSGEL
ncbi:restriction endonuclease subunit S [Endozoicomonas acroporae]|uniref:restriction endonuclease subunit S n=1 Tax=Endozoicomonas acroporae TaxID=1701104 RepID=UPI000C78A4F7|nr:restriction endonuclease subunit S [Endozoicomonas acroporae]